LTGLLTQSATEAPSGRVTIYAHKKAKTLSRRKRQAPKAGTATTIAKSTIDPTKSEVQLAGRQVAGGGADQWQ
jgi:hypothetical protein